MDNNIAFLALAVFGALVSAIGFWGIHENKKYLKEKTTANFKGN